MCLGVVVVNITRQKNSKLGKNSQINVDVELTNQKQMAVTTIPLFNRDLLAYVLKIFIFSRIVIALAIYFSEYNMGSVRPLLDMLTHEWDSVYFVSAATTGQFGGAFFPFYPLLIKIFSLNGIFSIPITGVVLNQALLLGSMYLLAIYLQSKQLPEDDARFACLILAISPMNIYFLATYSEPTFLFFTILGFYFLQKDRLYLAAICGMILSATRPVGGALAIIILYNQLRKQKFSYHTVLQTLIASSGIVFYCIYCQIYLGDFFHFLHSEANWGRIGWIATVDSPLTYLFENLLYGFSRDTLTFILAVIVTVVLFKKKFINEGLFNLLCILPGFISGSQYGIFYSAARLDAGIITFYIGLTLLCKGNLSRKNMVIILSTLFLLESWVRWTAGHWLD